MKGEKTMKKLPALALVLAMALTSCSTTQGGGSSSGSDADALADYPSGTITWIAPVAAGAAVDLPTRACADLLTFGTVVVENIAGANQTLGTAEAAARDADGHTLLTMANACGISQPILNPELSYSLDDFRYLTMLTPSVQATICVKKDSGFSNIEDLLEYMKENEFVYALPNAGGYADIAAATTMDQLGVTGATKMVYDGSTGAITAVLNGEALFSCTDSTDAVKYLDELDVLAIFDSVPCPILPDVPLLSDYGVEDLNVITGLKWIAVRADTPEEIVDYLKEQLSAAISSAEYQEYLVTMGFLPEGETFEVMTEEEVTAIVEEAGTVYRAVMEKTGMI